MKGLLSVKECIVVQMNDRPNIKAGRDREDEKEGRKEAGVIYKSLYLATRNKWSPLEGDLYNASGIAMMYKLGQDLIAKG